MGSWQQYLLKRLRVENLKHPKPKPPRKAHQQPKLRPVR